MSDLIYDQETGYYFNSVEEIFESYWDNRVIWMDAPEQVFECKPVRVDFLHASRCADKIIDYMDADMPEMASEEDEYFSNTLNGHAKGELIDLIHFWMHSHCSTVEPDFTKPIEFKKEYEEWAIPKAGEEWNLESAKFAKDAES